MSQEKPQRQRPNSSLKEWARYSGLAFELLGACLAGVLIGRWLDGRMGLERPTWAVFLTILFLIAALISLYRRLK